MPSLDRSDYQLLQNNSGSGVQSWRTWYDHDRLFWYTDDRYEVVTYPFFRRLQGRVIAHNIIDRDTNGKGDSAIHSLSRHLLGKELGGLRDNDGPAEFTNVNDGCSGKALRDDSLQSQIDNLGRFLVLCTDITGD
jgi:hypothetical protein